MWLCYLRWVVDVLVSAADVVVLPEGLCCLGGTIVEGF